MKALDTLSVVAMSLFIVLGLYLVSNTKARRKDNIKLIARTFRIAITAIGIILSHVVWKKRNVYLGIAIHCANNILGALGGNFGAMNGSMIVR